MVVTGSLPLIFHSARAILSGYLRGLRRQINDTKEWLALEPSFDEDRLALIGATLLCVVDFDTIPTR